MPPSNVKVVFDNTKKVVEGLRFVASTRVMAGVPAEKGLRKPEDREGQPLNNAELMYIHEFGAPEANIPARPVVYPAVKSIRKEAVWMLAKAAKAGMAGSKAGADRWFNAVGILAQNALQKRITDGPFAPLSERTLAARRARGRKGDKPLIDTGQLRRSLTYVIRKLIGR